MWRGERVKREEPRKAITETLVPARGEEGGGARKLQQLAAGYAAS